MGQELAAISPRRHLDGYKHARCHHHYSRKYKIKTQWCHYTKSNQLLVQKSAAIMERFVEKEPSTLLVNTTTGTTTMEERCEVVKNYEMRTTLWPVIHCWAPTENEQETHAPMFICFLYNRKTRKQLEHHLEMEWIKKILWYLIH